MIEAGRILDELGVEYETTIVSAHRTPARLVDYGQSARERGLKVIIAGAGGAAHLPGMTASETTLPVIGVPIESKALSGIDSLYSIVQMPPGIPVATISINGAKNAGLLAASILGATDPKVAEKLEQYRAELRQSVEDKAAKLEAQGPGEYLSGMA
jgi:5-(carboxyamino)imidazole ribonucleotide mutase